MKTVKSSMFFALTVLFIVLFPMVGFSKVTIEDSGYVDITLSPGEDASTKPMKERTITFHNNGSVTYFLHIKFDAGLLGVPGDKVGISIGDSTTKTMGWSVGVEGRRSGWYDNGTFGLLANGSPVTEGLPDDIAVGANDEAAWAKLSWQTNEGDVSVTFITKSGEDRLYAKFQHDIQGKEIAIKFVSLPGHVEPESRMPEERWLSTETQNLNEPVNERINLSNETNWILIFDRNTNRFRGFVALLFDTEEVKAPNIYIGPAPAVELPLQQGQMEARCVLWDFDENSRSPEEAYEMLKSNHKKYLEELRTINFNH